MTRLAIQAMKKRMPNCVWLRSAYFNERSTTLTHRHLRLLFPLGQLDL